jgi:hypothetical protein
LLSAIATWVLRLVQPASWLLCHLLPLLTFLDHLVPLHPYNIVPMCPYNLVTQGHCILHMPLTTVPHLPCTLGISSSGFLVVYRCGALRPYPVDYLCPLFRLKSHLCTISTTSLVPLCVSCILQGYDLLYKNILHPILFQLIPRMLAPVIPCILSPPHSCTFDTDNLTTA